jgi:hypothetical protein
VAHVGGAAAEVSGPAGAEARLVGVGAVDRADDEVAGAEDQGHRYEAGADGVWENKVPAVERVEDSGEG